MWVLGLTASCFRAGCKGGGRLWRMEYEKHFCIKSTPPPTPPRHSYLLKSNENLTFSDLSPVHHCHSMAILVALKWNSPHLFPQFIRNRDKNTTTPAWDVKLVHVASCPSAHLLFLMLTATYMYFPAFLPLSLLNISQICPQPFI